MCSELQQISSSFTSLVGPTIGELEGLEAGDELRDFDGLLERPALGLVDRLDVGVLVGVLVGVDVGVFSSGQE